jgi:hypothetical protein
MVDETADCSRHEQLVMCLRFCDNRLDIHEVITGFHELEHQDSATLFSITADILIRFNMDMKHYREICTDGAANVAGSMNGLQAKIRELWL